MKLFYKIIALLLILASLAAVYPVTSTTPASATTPEPVTTSVNVNNIEYGERIADPDTSAPENMGFMNIPRLHDGRIWTDKSVSLNPVEHENDFIVTLSALSQSYFLSDGYTVPTDTVFIVDMSGSMYQESINGRPRIVILVEALNEAIRILLDANPRNRIAVVTYGGRSGGYSRAQTVLPLGRPDLMAGAADFFTYRPGSPDNFVDVNTVIKLTDSVLVQGSTPTQRGILNGADILTSAIDLTIPALSTTGEPVTDYGGHQLMLTRKPNVILMTDGEPTMAWSDYLFENEPTDTNQNYGDGSYGETGVNILTVLTAAHRKRLIRQHYYINNTAHTSSVINYDSGNEPVGFYTVSLNDVPAPLLISSAMFPFDPEDTSLEGNADIASPVLNINNLGGHYPPAPPAPLDSMGELLRRFTSPAPETISFYAQYRKSFGNYEWQNVTITNPENLTLDELAFTDRYFPANDLQMLRDAFESITTDIQKQSYKIVTDSEPGLEEYDGYLVFSDVLGEYMQFKGITEFEFDGINFDRKYFAQMIINNTDGVRTRYESILYNHMNYGNMPGHPGFNEANYITASQVNSLIQSNIASGNLSTNNNIKYYSFGNRNFAGNFFNLDGSEADRPDNAVAVTDVYPMFGTLNTPVLTGSTADLMYITFHVITALENNTIFEEILSTDEAGNPLNRTLNKGDQMIRWYIPAVLIPQRTVDPDTGSLSGNVLPARISFRVGLNETLIEPGVPAEYITQHSDGDDVYFYTNRYPENGTTAFYKPHELNTFYQPGRPGFNERGVAKTSNPTETAPFVIQNRHTYKQDEGRTNIHRLGNNGRLTICISQIPQIPPEPPFIPPQSPPPELPPEQPPEPFLTPPPGTPPERAPQTGIVNRFPLYISIVIFSLGLTTFAIIKITGPVKQQKTGKK